MELEKYQSLLDNVYYKDYDFTLKYFTPKTQRVSLFITGNLKDNWGPGTVDITEEVRFSADTEEEFYREVFKGLMKRIEHETAENFYVNKELIYNPHGRRKC